MAKVASLIVKTQCPTCGKTAIDKSRIEFENYFLTTLECGHFVYQDKVKGTDYNIESVTKHYHPKPFQIEGIKFAEEAGFRCLIADEQGLGKTIQALGCLKLHPELMPAVIITKLSLKIQGFHEIREWCGPGPEYLTQVLNSGKERPLPGFQIYITTYDFIKNETVFDDVDFKTIIIDECQQIKNHLSGRAKAVQKLSARAENIIALSGTPIKNNTGEYFTILNIIKPSRFPTYEGFIRHYCDSYETLYGWKIGGLANPEFFHEETKDFIIRRTREEVAPELPKVFRQFYHVELDKKLNTAYREGLKELEELMYEEEGAETSTTRIAILTKMRRITGLSKAAEAAVEKVAEFLFENNRKLVIFLHHHSVMNLLEAKLVSLMKDGGFKPPLVYHAQLSSQGRDEVIRKFRDEDYRVMIASTLSAQEGLNLQFCSDAIMLERQWNPANEEQAEGRFSRFGSVANQVNIIYMLCSETIDEYFTELVEQKRAIVASTLDNKEISWESSNLMKELAKILVSKGKDKWKF